MSENIPYIIAEDGYYYVAYKEKAKVPEIVVSSKGIANGLSEEYNDGWDFGPDSYSPTSTSAIPYTQTVGWQEALSYLLAHNGGKMFVKNGYYDIGDNIIGITSLSSGTTPVAYQVPGTGSPTNQIPIEIEGETAITNTESAEAISDVNVAGVFIHSVNLTGTYLAILSFYGANVALRIKNIIISQPQYASSSGQGMKIAFELSTVNSNSIILENCFAMVDDDPSTAVGIPNFASGFDTGRFLYGNYPTIFKNCTAFGYPVGFNTAAHAVFIGGGAIYCATGVVFYVSDHPITFSNFDMEECSTYLYLNSTVNMPLFIYGTITGEWQTGASTYNISNFIYDPDNYLTGEIQLQMHEIGASSSLTPVSLSTLNNNGGLYLRIMQKPNNPAPTTPSVPASGTAQQNTEPYAVKVYVNGGALTEIQITIGSTAYTVYSNSTASAVYEGFTLPTGASITLTYTTAPTWEWMPE